MDGIDRSKDDFAKEIENLSAEIDFIENMLNQSMELMDMLEGDDQIKYGDSLRQNEENLRQIIEEKGIVLDKLEEEYNASGLSFGK